MKNKIEINLMCSIILMCLIGRCSCDRKAKIAIVKNNTSSRIIGAQWADGFMTDSILYNNMLYKEYWIGPDSSEIITLPHVGLSQMPDSAKDWIYFFNEDTLNEYQKLKSANGIIKHSLLKKIEIQLNKVKEPLDTIYVK